MAPLACCLAISFVFPVVLSNTDMQVLKNISELKPPTNLTIVDRQLGEVTISWNDGLSEIIKASTRVKYPFEYKYFDSQTWQEDSRLLESEYRKTFELHRGVSVRVKTMVQAMRKIKKVESNWTVIDIQPPPGDHETLASNVSCIVYNNSLMNCTWNQGSKAPHDTRYEMYYRQGGNISQCTSYFLDEDGRQGCHVSQIEVNAENVIICVNGSSNSTLIQAYYTDFSPWEYEMFNAPINLKVLLNLSVTWEMLHCCRCFQFQLQVTNLDQGHHEFFIVEEETKYSLQSINLTERYSVKVRVKSKSTCGENKYWSEWSNEVFIERTLSLNMHWFVHMSVVLVTMVGLLLIFAFGRYRVLEVAFKPIPNPQKKFKALFEEYNGDFQNWMNCQVPVSELDECHPVVIEEGPHIEA
ncbi:interleukin-5 receptor subunit alpha-like [Chiloscyllium plagiosum]|uniref:interleukin-5 receptor subunit alpha-like n=1 Tax=Chiloscyllium plagiosum TaxID=36176 RepID=UPI001CB88A3E|nr:interleukin-5 receptor subunit alpha-like [Chiloscyllium plagiosum]